MKNISNSISIFASIVIVNGKGGSSKSTKTMQVGGAYGLYKGLKAQIFEFDDENKDSEQFVKSSINNLQAEVGLGDGLNDTLREFFTKDENIVFDVGGNKTTSLFLNALKSSRMYRRVDLFIIPMSGGSQDVKNAMKTFEIIKEIDNNANIIFALSRVRNPKRIHFQYRDFFDNENSRLVPYFILKDSDVIDMSRNEQKSVYEIANDASYKRNLEKQFDKALDKDDTALMSILSITLEVYDEAGEYANTYLAKAFLMLDEILNKEDKGE